MCGVTPHRGFKSLRHRHSLSPVFAGERHFFGISRRSLDVYCPHFAHILSEWVLILTSMAQVVAYQTKAGKRYRVRYRKPDGRQTDKRGFKTKRDADSWAATMQVAKLRGEYVAPSHGRTTVGELYPDWLARKKASTRHSHWRMLESAWRTHVEPVWGKVSVAKVDQLAVESWIADLRGQRGATTVKRAHDVLAGILDDAIKGGRIPANKARGVDNLPRKTAKKHVYLTAADVERLAQEAGQYRVLVLVLAYCGLRWSEAIALRVSDVSCERKRLSVNTGAVQISSQHDVDTPKHHKIREVPVAAFLLDELARICEGKTAEALVFPRPGADGYMRRSTTGDGWFEAAVRRAKVQRVTPHELRHTCASLAISAGVNVLALQRMLGHASAKMTLDTYADLFDSDLDAVAEKLDAVAAGVQP